MSTKVLVHSLIMADRVIEEKDGRYGVIGMFSSITLDADPGQGPQWALVVEASGFERDSTYGVSITVSQRNKVKQPLCEIRGEVRTKDVTDTTTGIFSVIVPQMSYSVGVHEVSVYFNEHKTVSRFLDVICS